jgi:hypothetical protein
MKTVIYVWYVEKNPHSFEDFVGLGPWVIRDF